MGAAGTGGGGGGNGQKAGATLLDLPYHGIFDRGRLIGFWEYDTAAEKIVSATFAKAPKELAAELARTEGFIRDQLGDARSFSLDSPESRGPRIAALRKLAESVSPSSRRHAATA